MATKSSSPRKAVPKRKSGKPAGQPLGGQFQEEGEPKPSVGSRCPVVGFGASAGGLEAFSEVLAHLPPDTGMAFVLVQHLDPKHASVLAELLARSSAMPVEEVRDGKRVE